MIDQNVSEYQGLSVWKHYFQFTLYYCISLISALCVQLLQNYNQEKSTESIMTSCL